jgi:hypothetical protein
MIVLLAAEGMVVQDADELDAVRLRTELDPAGAGTALEVTGSGTLVDDDCAGLDLAVLRSRAELLATAPDWDIRWAAMVDRADAQGQLSDDRRCVRVPIERRDH